MVVRLVGGASVQLANGSVTELDGLFTAPGDALRRHPPGKVTGFASMHIE